MAIITNVEKVENVLTSVKVDFSTISTKFSTYFNLKFHLLNRVFDIYRLYNAKKGVFE